MTELAGRVHRQERRSRRRPSRMPSRVAVSGPIVEPHGHRVVGDELLVRAPRPPRRRGATARRAVRVGRVALVGVELEQRPAAGHRAGSPGRGARGSWGAPRARRRRTRTTTRPSPASAGPGSHRGRRSRGPARRRATDRSHRSGTPSRAPRGRRRRDQHVVGWRPDSAAASSARSAGVHGREVVHPAGGEQLVVDAEPRGRRRVRGRPGPSRRRRSARHRQASRGARPGHPDPQVSCRPDAEDGQHVSLLVQGRVPR